jgi:hypothetical protein
MTVCHDEDLVVYEYLPAWRIMPMIVDMHSRFPHWRDLQPYEVQASLWSLHYCDNLLPEQEISAALKVIRAIESQGRCAA